MLFDLYRRKFSILSDSLLAIPGLRGAWIAGNHDEIGTLTDITGQGRAMFPVGTPEFGKSNSKFLPWVSLDGTECFYRTNDPGLDLTGLETINAAAHRGMTMGGWFYETSLAAGHDFISKWDYALAANQRQYLLTFNFGAGAYSFLVSVDGAASTQVNSSVTPYINDWVFICGTFDPSTELSIFVNRVKDINTTAIPASVFQSTSFTHLCGRMNQTTFRLPGYFSSGFISDQYLPDNFIYNFFDATRDLYGV